LQDGAIGVTFAELWSQIGGGTRFTMDQVVKMMSDCLDDKQDFRVQHQNTLFIVKKADAEEYFRSNPRPEKPLSPAEKIVRLEAENYKLRQELMLLRSSHEVKDARPIPPAPPAATAAPAEFIINPHIEVRPETGPPQFGTPAPEGSGVEVDPASLSREKVPMRDLLSDLKRDLSDAKPLNRNDRLMDKAPKLRAETMPPPPIVIPPPIK
jgi:hypothetical protein